MQVRDNSALRRLIWMGLIVMLVLTSAGGGALPQTAYAAPPEQEGIGDAAAAADNMILSYAAKFVCTSALRPGEYFYGLRAPIVKQETQVLVHNPNAFAVSIYKKAVLAPVEDPTKIEQGVPPGKWVPVRLGPDYAFHIDCDDIAKLLTGKNDATFIGTYGIGATREGFVVIGSGVQVVAGTNVRRFGVLDVTAEYVRSSEFLKKDIHYQPWWRWWWWSLPWRLGYAYQRVLPAQPGVNIDCRDALYRSLMADAEVMPTASLREPTMMALEHGLNMDPMSMESTSANAPAALVALIGRCDKVAIGTQLAMSIDYVLVSNKGQTDPDPRTGQAAEVAAVRYPWLPGRWYDLALVTPQNLDVDMNKYMQDWQTAQWVAANGNTSATAITSAMGYYFPYWCGWGYWWWWWNAGDCVDIAVGAAESLDVEAVTPVRVIMPQWPPATAP